MRVRTTPHPVPKRDDTLPQGERVSNQFNATAFEAVFMIRFANCPWHEPQPVHAWVASLTACRLRAPLRTASMIRAFVTALQSQICAVSGIRSGPAEYKSYLVGFFCPGER